MATKIKIGEIDRRIRKILDAYEESVERGVAEDVKAVAAETAAEISAASPRRDGAYYAKSWRVSRVSRKAGETVYIIHNKDHYRLAHLLEKGHLVKNRPGGAVLGSVKARPHIAPAEKHAEEKLERLIIGTIQAK